MTLSLATRGYLCFKKAKLLPYGPGPIISGTASLEPNVEGAAIELGDVPSITGAGVEGPKIDGSKAPQEEPTGDTPDISGGGVIVPGGSGK